MSNHPYCCGVPMWLVKAEMGDCADLQTFECKVCDALTRRTVPTRAYGVLRVVDGTLIPGNREPFKIVDAPRLVPSND